MVDMPRARFGQIWTVEGATEGTCYTVVSDDGWNELYPTVFVIELDCRDESVPLEAGHRVIAGEPRRVALADRLMSVHERMLVEHIGEIASQHRSCIADAMAEVPLDYCIRGAARPVPVSA